MARANRPDFDSLPERIGEWARELGFGGVGIAALDLAGDAQHLSRWLDDGFHGGMAYMKRSEAMRGDPRQLRPGTVSVISARMDYLPEPIADAARALADRSRGYVARYALGRDYHRVLRARLKKLAQKIEHAVGPFGYRVFADSAPSLEKALARNARLGWIGKNTLLLDRKAGSLFLLGEIYCDVPLQATDAPPPRNHCGSCRACMDVCPTQAIVAPHRLDARRCISYLTIEHHGPIPLEFRKAIGNRIFGCDDCQLVCPWNQHARLSSEADFAPHHGLDAAKLTELFGWSEAQYLEKTEGMALRRTGYRNWLRNIAVALGNAPGSREVTAALKSRAQHPDEIVREHVAWALAQHV